MYCSDPLSLSIFETLSFWFFSPNVPVLVYYSHITAVVVSLLIGFFVVYSNRHDLAARILAVISVTFSAWSLADILLWTQINTSVIMFIWSFWFLFFAMMFALSLYFLYVFLNKKDAPFRYKLFFASLLSPILFLSATRYNLVGFDLFGCSAIENPLMINAVYAFAAVVFLSVCVLGLRQILQVSGSGISKGEVKLATAGVALFLLSFSVATYIASIANIFNAEPDTFAIEQYGYFGMTVFIAFLTYIIVRYKAFNVKLIAAQALVFGLVILIASQFLFIRNPVNRVLNGVTLALSLSFGFLLVKSVKREIEAKELIQSQKDQLEKANARLRELDTQKNEFLSFASHQIRSPLAALKGYTSIILEGDLGPISNDLREVVKTIRTSANTLTNVVEDYLNITRIELGTMKYDLKLIDLKTLVSEVIAEQRPNIESKGLAFNVSIDQTLSYPIKADLDKFKQVLMNVVDNSVKYTLKGSISISLERDPAKHIVRFKVVDTGVGIAPEVMPKLFRKFSRANNASEANIHGTGLGLFIAKEIVAAHSGKLWAESEGEGKGSAFIVEVPEVK